MGAPMGHIGVLIGCMANNGSYVHSYGPNMSTHWTTTLVWCGLVVLWGLLELALFFLMISQTKASIQWIDWRFEDWRSSIFNLQSACQWTEALVWLIFQTEQIPVLAVRLTLYFRFFGLLVSNCGVSYKTRIYYTKLTNEPTYNYFQSNGLKIWRLKVFIPQSSICKPMAWRVNSPSL